MMQRQIAIVCAIILSISCILTSCGEASLNTNVDSAPQSIVSSVSEETTNTSTETSSTTTETSSTTTETSSTPNETTTTSNSTTTSKPSTSSNSTATSKPSTSSNSTTSSKPATSSKPSNSTSVSQETPPNFPSGYITTKKTYIETKYVLFEIDANIYVVDDLAEKTDAMCAAMEKVSGLSFKTKDYGERKILVRIDREGITGDAEQSEFIPYAAYGNSTSSRGDECSHEVYLNPMDLFLGLDTTFLHEMAHALRFCQSGIADFPTVLEEGFATYVEYETMKYLEKRNTALAFALESSLMVLHNTQIDDTLYSETMEFWLTQDADYFRPYGNDNYSIGHRFLAFLKDVYGDCTKWIVSSETESVLDVVSILKTAYGKDVLSKFYPWMKQHEKDFKQNNHDETPYSGETRNLSGFAPINWYPNFDGYANETSLSFHSFRYKDLYINLEEAKRYLSKYKGYNTDDCYLALSDKTTVILYDKQGKVLRSTTDQEIPIKGVSYIKLSGSGYLGALILAGYYKPTETFDSPKVIYQGTIKAWESFVTNTPLAATLMRNDLEFQVEVSGVVEFIGFSPSYWGDLVRHEYVSKATCQHPCQFIQILNYSDKAVKVKITAVKKKTK